MNGLTRMSLATTYCRAALGIDAPLVTVEVHLANGLPAFSLVGLGEKAVQEARDRVRSALINSGFDFPARRITVNLAPADLPKQGARFDLAIAIGILCASGQIPSQALENIELIGELNLGGQIRPVDGVLPVALACRSAGRQLILPIDNADEASLVSELAFHPVDHLLGLCEGLLGRKPLPEHSPRPTSAAAACADLADVRGQAQARRALEVAACGRHNLLMMGPPGTGKSMLASRLPGILPSLTEDEALASAAIHSVAGQARDSGQWRERPFRAPHHTASAAALVGGSSNPRPGEISLAHTGVLFLDELPEFSPHVLDVLREPMETGEIVISRAARSATFPARFQLVAAMNPCKCGYANDPDKACANCSPELTARYQGRVSGPLRDRIDIQIEVPAIPTEDLFGKPPPAESSAAVRERVAAAWQRQLARQGCANADLKNGSLEQHCELGSNEQQLLASAIDKLRLSARAYHRILRVARSIADLSASPNINAGHLSEAIGYRRFDRR